MPSPNRAPPTPRSVGVGNMDHVEVETERKRRLSKPVVIGSSVIALALLSIIGWSVIRWTPTVFATPTANIIPQATYDFTYVSNLSVKAGGVSKPLSRTEAHGRINTKLGACELNATQTEIPLRHPDSGVYRSHIVRSSKGPTYADGGRGNGLVASTGPYVDLTDSLTSPLPTALDWFPLINAGENSNQYGSLCSITALGAVTTPSGKSGDYKWNVPKLIELHRASWDQYVYISSPRYPEPMFSIGLRQATNMAADGYAYEIRGMASKLPIIHVATNSAGDITISGSSPHVNISLVLTPTKAKVDTAIPKGTKPFVHLASMDK